MTIDCIATRRSHKLLLAFILITNLCLFSHIHSIDIIEIRNRDPLAKELQNGGGETGAGDHLAGTKDLHLRRKTKNQGRKEEHRTSCIDLQCHPAADRRGAHRFSYKDPHCNQEADRKRANQANGPDPQSNPVTDREGAHRGSTTEVLQKIYPNDKVTSANVNRGAAKEPQRRYQHGGTAAASIQEGSNETPQRSYKNKGEVKTSSQERTSEQSQKSLQSEGAIGVSNQKNTTEEQQKNHPIDQATRTSAHRGVLRVSTQ